MANSNGSQIKETLLLVFVAAGILLIILIWSEGVRSQQPVSLDGLGSTLSATPQSLEEPPSLMPQDGSAPAFKATVTPSPATVTPTLDISAIETSNAGLSDNLLDQ